MEEFMGTIERVQKELDKAVTQLAKTKNLDEKIKLSELIKNLSDTMGVYLNFASEMMMNEIDIPDEDYTDFPR